MTAYLIRRLGTSAVVLIGISIFIYLSGTGLILAVIIALPLGIFQAVKRNSLGDIALTVADPRVRLA